MSQFQPPFKLPEPSPQQPHTGYPQWQQAPQHPWYPPPPYQQTPPPVRPPQRRKRRERKETLIAVSIVLAILIVIGVVSIAFAHGSSNNATTTAQSPTATPRPTATPTELPTPTPAPTVKPTPNPHGDIGVTLSTGTWIVTLNNAYTSPGDEFDTPKPGDIYIVVDVTTLNNLAAPQLLSSGANFVFQDQTGQAYDESFTEIGKPPDGTVPANTKLRGQLVYEVSKSLHSFTLTFQDDSTPVNSITWNITE